MFNIFNKNKKHYELPIYSFKEKLPEENRFFAFVCPIEKDRWEIGWMDWHDIRVEGGPSYKPEQLTYWIPLPYVSEI